MRGIKAFLNNHRCNAICAALSLPQESPRNHNFSHNIVAQCETQYWRALPLLMRILVTRSKGHCTGPAQLTSARA
jgi:hypothetical protein